jgi:hypothetical protein
LVFSPKTSVQWVRGGRGGRGVPRHAPRSTNPAADIKESLRQQLVELFLTRKPRMSPIKAHRYTEITVQMVRALLLLYVETDISRKEIVLTAVLSRAAR